MTEKIGTYLKKFREEHSLTLREVEKQTGISNAYLSQLENDKIASPSPLVLNKLAECYRLPYEELMVLVGYPMPFGAEKRASPSFRSGNKLVKLTKEEEEKLHEYLQFLRTKRE